jgi:hypothetical protein
MLPVHLVGRGIQQAQQVRAEQQVLRPGLRMLVRQLRRAAVEKIDRGMPDPGWPARPR